MILGDVLIELLNQNHEIEEILLELTVGEDDGEGFHEKIETTGIKGDLLFSNLPKLLDLNINEIEKWDIGRFDGKTSNSNLINLLLIQGCMDSNF